MPFSVTDVEIMKDIVKALERNNELQQRCVALWEAQDTRNAVQFQRNEALDKLQSFIYTYQRDKLSGSLILNGHATDHIWLMEDVDGFIGIRMDSGDSGAVYVTKDQAKSLAEQLLDFTKE